MCSLGPGFVGAPSAGEGGRTHVPSPRFAGLPVPTAAGPSLIMLTGSFLLQWRGLSVPVSLGNIERSRGPRLPRDTCHSFLVPATLRMGLCPLLRGFLGRHLGSGTLMAQELTARGGSAMQADTKAGTCHAGRCRRERGAVWTLTAG